jgi:two-component system cell cycle response regulator DivK
VRVLVVEDQPIESKLAVTVLSAAGHEVERADAAEEALMMIKESQPDVILLDLSLPGMNGFALVRQLKGDPTTRGIPIVAVTSNPEEFSRAEAMSAGCDAYFPKPLSTRALPVMLAQVVANTENEPT